MTVDMPGDGVLMTLAGIAYGDAAAIPRYLNEAAPTTGWRVLWIPVASDVDDFCFVASPPSGGLVVVAVRGTFPEPFSRAYWDDAAQDSPFGTMVAWPPGTGARISAGTATALEGLMSLTDGAGLGLEGFVSGLPQGTDVIVVGHSLGGTLAPVMAMQSGMWREDLRVRSTSFAGMTPGDGSFAALAAARQGRYGGPRRVYNTLDTVAYGWNDVLATVDFYEPEPQGGPLVRAMIRHVAARLEDGGYGYAPVGDPVPLEGRVDPGAKPWGPFGYVFENLRQHMPDTYLALLGAPALPFSIGFGTVLRDGEGVSAGAGGRWSLPAVA